jgi:hypothetical protein
MNLSNIIMDLWMIISQIWMIIVQSFIIKTFFPNYLLQIQALSILLPLIYCAYEIINNEKKYYFDKREIDLEKEFENREIEFENREIEFENREKEFNLKKRELENKIFNYELRRELRERGITEYSTYEEYESEEEVDRIYIIDESNDESSDEYGDDEADMRSDTTELIN